MRTKLLLSFLLLTLSFSAGFSRDMFYIRSLITVNAGDTLYIQGNLISKSQRNIAIRNAGEIHLTGDLVNYHAKLFFWSTNGYRDFYFPNDTAPDDDVAMGNFSTSDDTISPLSRQGKVRFIGVDTQRIKAHPNAEIFFSDLYIGSHVVLESDIRVQGVLTLRKDLYLNGNDIRLFAKDSGNSDIGNVHLQWGGTGTIAGESDTSKITGKGRVIAIKGNPDAGTYQLKTLGLELRYTRDNPTNRMPVMLIRENRAISTVSDGSIERTFRLFTSYCLPGYKRIDSVVLHYFSRDTNSNARNSDNFAVWVCDGGPRPRRLISTVDPVRKIAKTSARTNEVLTNSDTLVFTLAYSECIEFRLRISLGDDAIINACDGETVYLYNRYFEHDVCHIWVVDSIEHHGLGSFPVTQTNTHVLRIKNYRGCEASDTIHVQFHPNPRPQILISNKVPNNVNRRKCVGDTFLFSYQEQLNDGLLSRTDIRSIVWNFGDGVIDSVSGDSAFHSYTIHGNTQTLQPIIALSVTSYHGCRGDASVEVNVINIPQPRITTRANSNIGTLRAEFEAEGNHEHAVIHTWFVNGDTTPVGTGNIFVREFQRFGTHLIGLTTAISDIQSCKGYTTIEVTVRDWAEVGFRLDTNVFCAGETIRLVNTTVVHTDRVNYEIDTGDGFHQVFSHGDSVLYFPIQDTRVDSIRLRVSIVGGSWSRTYSKAIRVNPTPVIGFGPNIHTCLSKTFLRLPRDTVTNYPYQYQWCDGSTAPLLPIAQDGLYTLTLTNSHGCSTTESVSVFLNTTLSTGLPRDTTHCGPIVLTASYHPGATYSWSAQEGNTRDVRIDETGTHYLKLTVKSPTGGSCEITDTVTVTIHEVPRLTFEYNTIEICPGETIALSVPEQSDVFYSWVTSYGRTHTGSAITTSHSGTYWLTAISQDGCENTAGVVVTVKNTPSLRLGNTLLVCDTLPIDFNLGVGSLATWIFPDGSQEQGHLLSTSQAGMHTVVVEYVNGCQIVDSINIQIGSPEIVADFLLASSVMQGDSVRFINLSYHPRGLQMQFLWYISDGLSTFTTTQENPYVRFGRDGEYLVSLTAYSEETFCPVVRKKTVIVTSGMLRVVLHSADDGRPDDASRDYFVGFLEAKLYPNPSDGNFVVRVRLSTQADIYALLMDGSGRVLDQRAYRNQDEYILEYYFDHLPAGIYFLRLWSGREVRDFRIIITE